jgi:hypothetical protein
MSPAVSLYVYGVVPFGAALPENLPAVEPARGRLGLVEDGPLAAVTSSLDASEARPTRANLEVHSVVVEALREICPVLPMSFGTVVRDADELRLGFLAPNRERLQRLIDAFTGKVEVRVEAAREGDSGLREIVASVPRVRRLRERVMNQPAAASYYDRLALGRLVQESLARLNERDSRRIVGALGQSALRVRRLSGGEEDAVFRAAFLIEGKDAHLFDQAVARVAEEEQDSLKFRLVGPLAPWDFVELPVPKAVRSGPATARAR